MYSQGINMLGEKIRKIRIKKGLSQEKVARLANVSYNTIAKIESGVSNNPTIQTLYGIANALEVSLDELMKNNTSKKE
jgi:transcriptional regulator with XRE-family HTH domain